MTFRFAEPWVFALLAVIPLWALWSLWMRGRRAGVMTPVLSRVERARGSGVSLREGAGWLAAGARAGGLALLIVALARPQALTPRSEATRDAIALQLVVDRSGSMREPVVYGGERMTRLDAVKRIVRGFVEGDGRLYRGREGDLLGLIAFGSFADTLSPLTSSHGVLVEALDRLEVAADPRERATAIGDALVLGNARLRAAEDAMREELDDPEFAFRSKAVVLLTDGENNAGVYAPEDGAQLAAEWGVRVYIIGLRDHGGRGFLAGMRERMMEAHERAMRAVAEHTGGRFWAVDNPEELAEAYAQIDELERTEIRVSESTDVEELFHRYAVLGVLLLGAEVLLRGVAGGRLP